MTVRLLPLACPRCGVALPAQAEEVVFFCRDCGGAARVDGERVVEQPVCWGTPAAGTGPEGWLPFWVFPGPVQFASRETRGLFGSRAPDDLWRRARRLWVPAFACTVAAARQWGASMTSSLLEPTPGEARRGAALTPCVLTPEDGRELAEFVVLSIEAQRSDTLSSLSFSLPEGEPELWVLPFAGQQVCAA